MAFEGFEKHEAVLETSVSKRKPIPLPHLSRVPSELLRRYDAFSNRPLQPALRASFRNTRATSEKRGQICVNKRRASDSRQIGRRFQTREKCVRNFASRHTLLAVTRWNIARPIPNVLTVRAILRSEENRRMSVLVSSHLARPENFHEITRFRLINIIEISTKPQLVKETRRAWAICVPSPPDAFSIALVANDQTLKRAVIQTKLTTFAQSFDGSDKHQIRCARTETWPGRNDKEFSRLEMCRRLQANLCKMRNRVTTAFGHLPHLLQNQVVAIASERELRRDSNKRRENTYVELVHRRISKHRNLIWQRRGRDSALHCPDAADRRPTSLASALGYVRRVSCCPSQK